MKFTPPKTISPYYNCKRIPRKFKKKHKKILNQFPFLEVNQKLWYLLGYTNKEYKQFLINQVTYDTNYINTTVHCL